MSDESVAHLLTFAHALKGARQARGLSTEELSQRLGIAPEILRQVELAQRAPDAEFLHSIERELALSKAQMLEALSDFERLEATQASTALAANPSSTNAARSEDTLAETLVRLPNQDSADAHDVDRPIRALEGQSIRGYFFLEKIGEGGFGAVYRARQLSVGRDVAIKVVKPDLADDIEFIRRFEAEAELVARLEHPHIVPLYDFWREPGAAFMVMRLLKGGSLSQFLRAPEQSRASLRVLPVIHHVAQALHAAHRAGVIHRDFKPANILLDEQGNACLADFGVAKQLQHDSGRTGFGEVVGSIAYCSPEQLRGEDVSAASDIYALGLVAFELISGRRPFASTQASILISQHLYDEAPKLSEFVGGVPVTVDAVIARALSKEKEKRQNDALSFAAELDAAFRGMESSWMGSARIAIGDVNTTGSTAIEFAEIDNPYIGLASFDEGDAPNFFGREVIIEQLLEKMRGEKAQHWLKRALVVVGASGSGKSSVVRAGVIPALRNGAVSGSRSWLITTLVPGVDPLANLAAALKRVSVRDFDVAAMLRADQNGLSRAIDRCLPNEEHCELLLVLDQFEELFTLARSDADTRLFIALIATALRDPNSRLRIICTLRADFLDRPLQYPELAEVMRERTALVPAMSLDELERAIVGPARRAGLIFEEGLVAAILDEVSDQLGALPLLQYALSELFVKRKGRELTHAAFREMGGVRGALAGRAEAVFQQLDPLQQTIARQLFLRLTTLGEGREDTRRRVSHAELVALFSATAQAPYTEVLSRFTHARLLMADRDAVSHDPTVEVAHEALLRVWARLSEWLQSSRAYLRLQRQLAEAARHWQANLNEASFLLSGARLEQFRPLGEQNSVQLTELEQRFLERSIASQDELLQAEQQRQQRELEQAQALAEQRRIAAELAEAAAQTQIRGNKRLQRLVAVLAAILLFALWQAWQLNRRSNALALETARANIEAKSAGALGEFWQDLFANADPDRAKGAQLQVRDVLDSGLLLLDQKLSEAPIPKARLLLTIARTYRQMGVNNSAAIAIERALETLKSSEASLLQVELMQEQARIQADSGQAQASLQTLEALSAIEATLKVPELVRATTLNIQASVLNDLSRPQEAITVLREVLSLRQANHAPSAEIARTMNNLAFSLSALRQLKEANAMFASAYQLSLAETGPDNIATALTQLNLARTERDLGRFDVAEQALNTVIGTLDRLFPEQAHDATIDALIDRAVLYRMNGQMQKSLMDLDRAQAIQTARQANPVKWIGIRRERGETLTLLGQFAQAHSELKQCGELAMSLLNARVAARCQLRESELYWRQNDPDNAKRLLALALAGTSATGSGLEHARLLLLQARLQPELIEKNAEAIQQIVQDHQEFWSAKALARELAHFNR